MANPKRLQISSLSRKKYRYSMISKYPSPVLSSQTVAAKNVINLIPYLAKNKSLITGSNRNALMLSRSPSSSSDNAVLCHTRHSIYLPSRGFGHFFHFYGGDFLILFEDFSSKHHQLYILTFGQFSQLSNLYFICSVIGYETLTLSLFPLH